MRTSVDFATINIEGQSYRILCGKTGAPITVVANDDPKAGQLTCADTGQFYEPDHVAQIALQNAKDELQLALNRNLREAVKDTDFVDFSRETVNNRTYEFVVDFQTGPVDS